MLVTVLIPNYNYGRFLAQAIDSALAQTYPSVEVVVVDDGSTDHSREVISSYGSRVVPVLKPNGGQGSAFNAGFEASTGELVCFLDADDLFLPTKITEIVAAWQKNDDATVVYHQLQIVDANGNRMGRPWPQHVWRADIRERVARSGAWWPHPTTTAICCPSAFLRSILPMPNEPFRLFAETYVARLAAFFGPVFGIRRALGLYRLHGGNLHNRSGVDRRVDARRRAAQGAEETRLVRAALIDRFDEDVNLAAEDNFGYQRDRWAAGDVPTFDIVRATATCPALPPLLRAREIARIGRELVTQRVPGRSQTG